MSFFNKKANYRGGGKKDTCFILHLQSEHVCFYQGIHMVLWTLFLVSCGLSIQNDHLTEKWGTWSASSQCINNNVGRECGVREKKWVLSSGVIEKCFIIIPPSFFYAGKERNAPVLLGRFFILLKWKSVSVEMRGSHRKPGRRSSCQLQEATSFQTTTSSSWRQQELIVSQVLQLLNNVYTCIKQNVNMG